MLVALQEGSPEGLLRALLRTLPCDLTTSDKATDEGLRERFGQKRGKNKVEKLLYGKEIRAENGKHTSEHPEYGKLDRMLRQVLMSRQNAEASLDV